MKTRNIGLLTAWFGLFYLYTGEMSKFLLYFFTGQGCGIWWLYNLIKLSSMTDEEFDKQYNTGYAKEQAVNVAAEGYKRAFIELNTSSDK